MDAGDLRARAEIAIQNILLNLEEQAGKKIDRVDVDTRNFANSNVEIFFAGE